MTLTFFLINIPLPLFAALTAKFFYQEADLQGWKVAMTFQIILIPVVNIFFLLASLTDPGIVPGRSWLNTKPELAEKYRKVNSANKIFYNSVNP